MKKQYLCINLHDLNMIQSTGIITDLRSYFQSEPRILHAWLFGSFARNDVHKDSDVDVMIEMKADKPYTLFDLFDIQHSLEKRLNRKVDLVEKDFIKPAASASVQNDLIAIV